MSLFNQTLIFAVLFHLLGTAIAITAAMLAFNAFTTGAYKGIVEGMLVTANTLFLPAFVAQRFHYPTNESFASQFTSSPFLLIPTVESIAWALVVGFLCAKFVSTIAEHLSRKLK